MGRTLFLFLFAVLQTACGRSSTYPPRNPPEGFLQRQTNIAAGQDLFMEHCVRCHGTVEEGRGLRAEFHPPAPSFKAKGYRSVDPAYLFWRISTGKTAEPYLSRGSVMPAWGPYFSDDQIWMLVAYIRMRSL